MRGGKGDTAGAGAGQLRAQQSLGDSSLRGEGRSSGLERGAQGLGSGRLQGLPIAVRVPLGLKASFSGHHSARVHGYPLSSSGLGKSHDEDQEEQVWGWRWGI